MRNALILLFLFISISISGVTYYIDPSGNNNNNGSINAPWSTLAYACAQVYKSGDIIHINAGTYIETNQCILAVGVSIEGVGATSIIKSHYTGGSDLNNALIILSGGTNAGQHISGIKLDGDALRGDKAISVYNRNNVSIYNCTIVDFSIQGVRLSGSGNNTGNRVYNNTISNCGGYDGDEHGNLSVSYNTSMLIYGNTITQNQRPAGYNGIGLQVEGNFYGGKIYNNNINGLSPGGRNINFTFAVEFWCNSKSTGHGLEMYGNNIIGEVDFGAGVTKGNYAYGIDFHDNTLGGNSVSDINDLTTGIQLEEIVSDVIIRNNLFRNIERPVYFCSNGTAGAFNNIKIYNNLFRDIPYGYGSAVNVNGTYYAHGVAILFGGSGTPTYVRNIYIWNNTMTGYSGRAAEIAIWLPTNSDGANFYIQNNIIQGFAVAPIATVYNGGGKIATLVIQKNVLYQNGNSNNLLSTNFTSTNVINDGGVKSNPLLVSANDFHLQTGSPAIGKGIPIAGLTTDYEGKAFNNPPSIGAYEAAAKAAPPASIPVYQNSVVDNATPFLLELTYNTILANIIPDVSAFRVLINSVSTTVTKVTISGTKVQLTLMGEIKFGDIVTVSYIKPSNNPIQSASNGEAPNLSDAVAINNVLNNPDKEVIPVSNIKMSIYPNPVHQIINILLESTSSLSSQDASLSSHIIRIFDMSGKLFVEKLLEPGITNFQIPINLKPGLYTVLMLSGSLNISVQKLMVY